MSVSWASRRGISCDVHVQEFLTESIPSCFPSPALSETEMPLEEIKRQNSFSPSFFLVSILNIRFS